MMKLDLVKLFPESCKKLEIAKLAVNFNDIVSFYRDEKSFVENNQIVDIVILKDKSVFQFTENDEGIFQLAWIALAKQTLDEFDEEKLRILGLPEDYIKRKKTNAINFLQMANSLYGLQ